MSRPPYLTHSEQDKPHPVDVVRCQRWTSQSVGKAIAVATLPCWDSTASEWEEERAEGSGQPDSLFHGDAELWLQSIEISVRVTPSHH